MLRSQCNIIGVLSAFVFLSQTVNICAEDLSERPECINIRQCLSVWKMLESASKPLKSDMVNYLKEIQCGFDGKDPKVLCPGHNEEYQNFPPFTNSLRASSKLDEHENYHLLPSLCGPTSLWDLFTLGHGTETHLNEYPWMALIRYRTKNGLEFLCQGSLISERYVLTAASCVTELPADVVLVSVRLGEYDLAQPYDCDESECNPQFQEITVESMHHHPYYLPPQSNNNIALVRLAWPADFTHVYVKPICMPVDDGKYEDFNGDPGILAGWDNSNVLQYKNCTILSNTKCAITQNNDPYSRENDAMCAYEITETSVQFCASGNPFFSLLQDDFKYMQFGILNQGPKTCEQLARNEKVPLVFTKVSHHMKWILDTLRP